jgi:Tfp pilus assembly pilus retraction ATPase PilT
MGPTGCGKPTCCFTIVQHAVDNNKTVDVVNLDPVAEYFDYQPLVDIREGGRKVAGSIHDGVIIIFH